MLRRRSSWLRASFASLALRDLTQTVAGGVGVGDCEARIGETSSVLIAGVDLAVDALLCELSAFELVEFPETCPVLDAGGVADDTESLTAALFDMFSKVGIALVDAEVQADIVSPPRVPLVSQDVGVQCSSSEVDWSDTNTVLDAFDCSRFYIHRF